MCFIWEVGHGFYVVFFLFSGFYFVGACTPNLAFFHLVDMARWCFGQLGAQVCCYPTSPQSSTSRYGSPPFSAHLCCGKCRTFRASILDCHSGGALEFSLGHSCCINELGSYLFILHGWPSLPPLMLAFPYVGLSSPSDRLPNLALVFPSLTVLPIIPSQIS